MKILLTALLLAVGLLCAYAHAQRDDAARFLEVKAKAERAAQILFCKRARGQAEGGMNGFMLR